MRDTSGAKCGYIKGAVPCSPRTCGDEISSPSMSVCEGYLNTCTFDGTNCLARAACSSYKKTTADLCSELRDTSGT